MKIIIIIIVKILSAKENTLNLFPTIKLRGIARDKIKRIFFVKSTGFSEPNSKNLLNFPRLKTIIL